MDALSQLRQEVGARDVAGEDHELVAADAGDRVLVADNRAQPPRRLDEHAVPGDVPVVVVDRLEVVEVDEHQPHQAGVAGQALAGAGDAIHRAAAGSPGR